MQSVVPWKEDEEVNSLKGASRKGQVIGCIVTVFLLENIAVQPNF